MPNSLGVNMNIKDEILDYCRGLGLDCVGVMECRKLTELQDLLAYRKENSLENEFEEEDIEKRVAPDIYMKEGKAIISIAFPYLCSKEKRGRTYFSKYTLGMDYHKVVSMYLKKICEFINELGGEGVYFVDSNTLPERYIAYQAGVGFTGKNNMIITEKYGSYVFLGEIITNLELEPDAPIKSKCGKCDLCEKACPSQCLKGRDTNPNICLSYITQKKHIEDLYFDKMGGRLFGCDTCQEVCPYNKEASLSRIKEFKTYDFMENFELEEIILMSNSEFKDRYYKTSCGWRGRNVLQRNALINYFNMGKIGQISDKDIKSTYVKDYYHRLLEYFKL